MKLSPQPMQVSEVRPGTPVSRDQLLALGFHPHGLRFSTASVAMIDGTGCEWDTVGNVPSGPGLYLFTLHDQTEDPDR